MIIQAKYKFWKAQAAEGERLNFVWAGTLNDHQVCIAADGFILACVPVKLDETDVPGAFSFESKVFESVLENLTTDWCPECDNQFQDDDVTVQISLGKSEIYSCGYAWQRRKFTPPDFEKFLKKIESTLSLTESTQEFVIDLQLLDRLSLALGNHRLKFRVTNPESPILVKPNSDDWFTPPFGVIMPMRKIPDHD